MDCPKCNENFVMANHWRDKYDRAMTALLALQHAARKQGFNDRYEEVMKMVAKVTDEK